MIIFSAGSRGVRRPEEVRSMALAASRRRGDPKRAGSQAFRDLWRRLVAVISDFINLFFYLLRLFGRQRD